MKNQTKKGNRCATVVMAKFLYLALSEKIILQCLVLFACRFVFGFIASTTYNISIVCGVFHYFDPRSSQLYALSTPFCITE